jgi:glycosyltransferase involved in cell wall biosynthesis
VEDCLRLKAEIRRAGGDCFHSPVVLGPLRSINIPLWAGVPVVSTVHDLHVETLEDPVMRAYRREMRYTVQRFAIRRTHIITDSEFTKRMLEERGIGGRGEITVIPVCTDEVPLQKGERKENMVLFIGDARHKNTASAIQVFKVLSERAPGWRYVMVGSQERIHALGGLYAKELQSAGILQIEEDAPDEILNELFARAAILFMPSLSEGFGIPVLQAFAGRAAVVVSDRGSLPEVGGDAAVVVDPENLYEMVSTLEGLMKNGSLREELARRGAERLKLYDYKVLLPRLAELYREVAKK